MSKLYEMCTLCDGAGVIGRLLSGLTPTATGEPCFGCKGTGFVEIGLTTGQVERMVLAERKRRGDPAVVSTADDLMGFARVVRDWRAASKAYRDTPKGPGRDYTDWEAKAAALDAMEARLEELSAEVDRRLALIFPEPKEAPR